MLTKSKKILFFIGFLLITAAVLLAYKKNSSLTKTEKLTETKKISQVNTGKWMLIDNINPLDDSRDVLIALNAENITQTISFVARCNSNEISAYIMWNEFLGLKESIEVTVRIGTKEASIQQWSGSNDSKTTFSVAPLNLISEMLKTERLVTQVTPYRSSPITAIFNTSGMKEVIKPLQESCSSIRPN